MLKNSIMEKAAKVDAILRLFDKLSNENQLIYYSYLVSQAENEDAKTRLLAFQDLVD